MNRYYLIIPIVLMAVFVYFERSSSAQIERERVEAIEKKNVEEQKKQDEKKALEAKAKIDQEKRNIERLADEERLRKKKADDFAAKIQKLKDDAKKYTDGIAENTKAAAAAEKELNAKRAQHEQENRAVLELSKKVEITKKARRSAELEVQRFTEMLTVKANEAAMAKPPVVATAATATENK
jgi:hypothetical protein